MDLVEISPQADPPVARIMNYGQYLFQQNKQKNKRQRPTKVKEVKFRPVTEKGDYEVKMRKIHEFLEEGDKVRVIVFFRGREMAHQALGVQLLERVRNDLLEAAKIESFPQLEGRQLIMVVAPKGKK